MWKNENHQFSLQKLEEKIRIINMFLLYSLHQLILQFSTTKLKFIFKTCVEDLTLLSSHLNGWSRLGRMPFRTNFEKKNCFWLLIIFVRNCITYISNLKNSIAHKSVVQGMKTIWMSWRSESSKNLYSTSTSK